MPLLWGMLHLPLFQGKFQGHCQSVFWCQRGVSSFILAEKSVNPLAGSCARGGASTQWHKLAGCGKKVCVGRAQF